MQFDPYWMSTLNQGQREKLTNWMWEMKVDPEQCAGWDLRADGQICFKMYVRDAKGDYLWDSELQQGVTKDVVIHPPWIPLELGEARI